MCSREVSDEFSRISLYVCCDGRWIFRSGIGRILTSTLEFGASATRRNLGDSCTLQFSLQSSGSVLKRAIECDRV